MGSSFSIRTSHSLHLRHIYSSSSSSNTTIPITILLDSRINPTEPTQIHARAIKTNAPPFSNSPFQWNCLMRSYLRQGLPSTSLRLYLHMARSGLLPDLYTLPIALKAACQLHLFRLGRQLHSCCVKLGLDSDEYCESGIISVYVKSGGFDDARKVFDGNGERKLGSWNAVISGLARDGRSEEVVGLFGELRRCGFRPDDVTMVSTLSACGGLGDLNLGQQMHKCVLQAGVRERNCVVLMNSLVDMYGKCGRTDLAYRVFSRMVERNVSTWTAMIMGLAMHGRVDDALGFFHWMRVDGVRPNHVTFVSVLSACAHGGLIKEGMDYFDMMVKEYEIDPTIAHYGCIVDLLGRVGRLDEARLMVERMPMRANAVILGTLLSACVKHGSVDVGKWVANKLCDLEPWNDGVYVVLSNLFANASMWEEVEQVRNLMKGMNVAKAPAYSLATVST